MKTRRLYHENVYLKDFEATVVSKETSGEDTVVILDQTAFFPEGGGQSCDTGTLDKYAVIDVFEDNDAVYHKIKGPFSPEPGDRVSGSLNWERRFENMQRHCGEHLLTGIFYREYGGVNRGFHMGDEYMTIDISMEDDPEYRELTWDMVMNAERLTNELIWENVPMIKRHFDTIEEVKDIPVRKKVTVEEDITLVGIASEDYGWGCCACCGTHPDLTGQVGLVKVFKLEPNKGMWRIYFEAGRRAYLDYTKKCEIIDQLGRKYSAGPDDLLTKMASQEAKQKEVRQDYFALRQSVIAERAALIQAEISDGRLHTYTYKDFKQDDYRNLAKHLTFSGLVIFCDEHTDTALLYSSGSPDCGKLVKDNAEVFGGKGGGRKDNAQGRFSTTDNMYLFADALEKILR